MQVRLYAPDGSIYSPLPKQAQFHASPAKFRAYVGGFGSGKTLSGCAEAFHLSLDQPGNVGLIGRKSYKELKATTQMEFFRLCPPELIESFNANDGVLKLKNGSTILFWNLQDPATFRSLNLGWFYIDEASEVDEEVFSTLRGRLRLSKDKNGIPIRRCGILTTNPNGHDWIWKWWVSKQGDPHVRRNYQLIHAPTRENKYLPADYIRDLELTYPPEWLARFMEGSFDVFEGQVYPALDSEMHVIPISLVSRVREYIYPLVKMRAIDHGFNNPTVCLWGAVDYFGNVFIYREYRRSRRTIAENCYEINQLSEGEEYYRTLIDPSTNKRTGQSRLTLLEEYHENGLYAEPANNIMRAGIMRVSEYLRVNPEHPNPITGTPGSPHIFFFPNIQGTYEEMRQLAWKKLKPGQERNTPEEPVDKDDHGPDCVRYMVMDRPLPTSADLARTEYSRVLDYVNALSSLSLQGEPPTIGMDGTGSRKVVLPNGFTVRK